MLKWGWDTKQTEFVNFVLAVQPYTYERRHEISNNMVCATNKGSDLDQPLHTRSLLIAFASRFNII